MNKWKATLPKEPPKGAKSAFIIGIKDSTGARWELEGVMDNEKLVPIFNDLIMAAGKKPLSQ